MPVIRLLTSITGGGPVVGDAGDTVTVDAKTARDWADGVRAERVVDRTVPVEKTAEVVTGGKPTRGRGGPETSSPDGPQPDHR